MSKFGTKSETLKYLSDKITSAKILPQISFTVKDWSVQQYKVLKQIEKLNWYNIPLIIRSSAINEDTSKQSYAGCYESILNVLGKNNIINAVNQVILSYTNFNENDQVLVQPLLIDVIESGVIFSRDPNTGGFYIVVNYDNKTQYTDSITSGKSNTGETYYYCKDSKIQPDNKFIEIIRLTYELEQVLETDLLDIEYALTKQDIYLLQVRPLILTLENKISQKELQKSIDNIYTKVQELNKNNHDLFGYKTILGIMPDWNPAEIIGVRPKPLALSLYKELITNTIWAQQRKDYGYKNMIGFPLLVDLYGSPYIDVRVSFNSFIPKDISNELSEKLCNYYLNKLQNNPSYHDKIEFKIVFSCYTFDFDEKIKDLLSHGITLQECNELKDNLIKLTNHVICVETNLLQLELDRINQLDLHRKAILNSNLDNISKSYWLIEYCKKYGTLPFAGLARIAFIAVELLKSLVNIGILTQTEYQEFMLTINTVSSQMKAELHTLTKDDFLNKYGHLRPGSYDILSPRYDEVPDAYFDWDGIDNNAPTEIKDFNLPEIKLKKLDSVLKNSSINYNASDFLGFIKLAIESREYAKFIFTHTLSDLLSIIGKIAIDNNLTLEQISYIDIYCIKALYTSSTKPTELLNNFLKQGLKMYTYTKQLVLPPIIYNEEDLYHFFLIESQPNFITQNIAIGKLTSITQNQADINNRIVMIPSADPGYDWIFTHNILGLITMYGGINSHMAIRANELGIPAVIGAGDKLFNKWMKKNVIEINCSLKYVKIIN